MCVHGRQYFPVVLFIMQYQVVLHFESLAEILKCDHSDDSLTEPYFAVMLYIMLYKVIEDFEVRGSNPKV